MGQLCTYRVGGPARWFVEPNDADELLQVARIVVAKAPDVPVLVVGRGSNLLVCDTGFDGLVVRLGAGFDTFAANGSVVVAGAAAGLPVTARRSVAAGLTGFEWAVGVPGSIGGAVRMNAGGHGSNMAATLSRVRVLDLRSGENSDVSAKDLDLRYRASSLQPHQVVLEATFGLAPGDRVRGLAELAEIVRWRRENQPGGHNAGSVFANPGRDSAGRLIEAAGARGLRVGSAAVSTKHANFIQSDESGSADDVFALMVEVARRVRAHSGVQLHPETRLVGFPEFDSATR